MIFEKRPTKAVIHMQRLIANLRAIQNVVPTGQELMPIIKANAYGHGSVAVARVFEDMGIKRIAVATCEEGVELRQNGITKTEIFILNGVLAALKQYQQHRLIPVLHQMDEIEQVRHYAESQHIIFTVGIKFDTGMGRLGILPDQVVVAIDSIREGAHLNVACVLTHLARADESLESTLEPYARFTKIRETFRKAGFVSAKFSICNSASILDRHFEDYDWVRPGIALYGAYPHPRQRELLELKPVLELKTRIIELKKLACGAPVGYGGTFVTARDSQIAILPIGYADGYPRLISNRGEVLVRGRRVPIVGRISMDLMTVDVTDVWDVCLYDEVTLIGSDGGECIRVEEVAAWAETISYEVLTGIMPRVHREYV